MWKIESLFWEGFVYRSQENLILLKKGAMGDLGQNK